MNRREALLGLSIAVALPPLVCACGSDPPPPTVMSIVLQATQAVNLDNNGTAQPVRVRIFRLSAMENLPQTDFFTLDEDPNKALGQDLVGFENVILAPGATTAYERTCEPEVKFIGLVASYFAINTAQWRAWKPVKSNERNAFDAIFDAAGITFKEVDAS